MTAPTTLTPWLSVQEFLSTPLDHGSALLRLVGRLDGRCAPPVEALLIVRRGDLRTCHRGWPATAADERRGRRVTADAPVLWRATFQVPLEVMEYREAMFKLVAGGQPAIALPAPCRRRTARGEGRGMSLARQARRQAVALLAGVAAAAAVSAGAIASASTTAAPTDPAVSSAVSTATSSTDTTQTVTDPTGDVTQTVTDPTGDTTTTTSTSTSPLTTTTTTTPTATSPPAETTPTTPTVAVPAPPVTPPPPAAAPQPAPAPQPAAAIAPSAATPAPAPYHHLPPASGSPHHDGTSEARPQPGGRPTGHGHRPGARQHSARPASPSASESPADATPPGVGALTTALPLDPFTAAQIAHFESIGAGLDQPPPFLIPIYRAAGRRYHVPWQILAAINAIETDYGRDLGVSVAGAVGWMQFEPATWLQYGVRVGGTGPANPYDPRDAIFSAARYLAASGAPLHLRQALFAYNHALWYVDAVLWRAQLIGDRSLGTLGHRSGYALPLDARYMQTLGRTDDGVDIETAPDGAAVYSITPGIVTAVASDPSGFGPDYPVVLVTAGPLAGQDIYYGHVAASLVRAGDHVVAGQPIAVMGHTGDAAGLGHGHIEIGFSDGSGDPLNHGGAAPWTPSGEAMRRVLEALDATYNVTRRS